MSTVETLREFIVRELHWDGNASQLTPDFALIQNHVLDSMGLFLLVSFINEHFGVQVEIEELVPDNFGTLSAIVNMIDRKRAGQ